MAHKGPEQLLALERARELILARISPLSSEPIPLDDALGRVTAAIVSAPRPVPPFTASAMDGYAVRAADTAVAPVRLTVEGAAGAGERHAAALGAGGAVRIMTGAPLPPGADCVVPIEEVEANDDSVLIKSPQTAERHLRPEGNNIAAGEVVLSPGHKIGVGAIGVAASLGFARIEVHRRPRVAIISTGRELVPPGSELKGAQIHDSNADTLAAAVAEQGGIPQRLPIAGDDLQQVVAALERAAASECDMVISSGGVSVGDHDFVRDAIERVGKLLFWGVQVRPGKPFAFGTLGGEKQPPIFGMPGNPVSALVLFHLLCRPALRVMQGLPPGQLASVSVVLDGAIHNPDARRVYARVQLHRDQRGTLRATPLANQTSAALKHLEQADGLAICPADRPELVAGATTEVVLPQLDERLAGLLGGGGRAAT